jgi:hypothetical protein
MANTQEDFNWQAYLAANPDVANSTFGVSPERAWEHYSNYGVNEGKTAQFDGQVINSAQEPNRANFNYIQYLKDNPDVANSTFGLSDEAAWEHYSNFGSKEGRTAQFNLGSLNTIPSDLQTNQETGVQYSTTPGHVGYVADVANPFGGTTKQWMPSAFDFTGAKFDSSTNTYTMPSGEKVAYDFTTNDISSYQPNMDMPDPSSFRQGYGGQTYASTSGQKTANFQGLNLSRDVIDQKEYLVNPNTNQYARDQSGNFAEVYHAPKSGGFDKFITENGWMIPLAMITAGAGASAFGGAAAAGEGGLTGASGAGGSMGAGSSLQLAPAGMGAGTGVGGGIVAPSLAAGLGVGSGGVLGAGALSAETIAAMEAMNAGAGWGLNASQVPNLAAGLELGAESGLTASQALDYANQARKIYSTGNNLAKLLGGSGAGTGARTGTGSQQIANSLRGLATPIQSNDYLGQYKMNQNPFTFTSQGQTTASPGTYDVSGSSMANALRKS